MPVGTPGDVLRILPDPDRPYSELKDDLVRLGWVWAGEAQVLPLLPGEPEWVEYRHPAGGHLQYEFNPAIGLREIAASGPPELLTALSNLSRLGPFDVAALLDSQDVESILRGLFAARSLRLTSLLGRITALCHHPDDLVQRAASDVVRTLPPAAVGEALERFHAFRSAYPDRSALVAMMPVDGRRQVLRWIGHDRREANADVLAALRSGLADDDAEVRATAALVAAKLGAVELVKEVQGLEVPGLFVDARARALEALSSRAPLRLPEPTDDETLLLLALLEPLPVVPPPPSLPRHLTVDGGTVRLARSGIEVALVAAMPHWVGSSRLPQDRLRRITGTAFAIAVEPMDARAPRAAGIPVGVEGSLQLDEFDAKDLVRRLGEAEGAAMSLPSEEQWEMAMRGPDGRRHVAGNLEPEPSVSPWGLVALPGLEWVAGGVVRDAGELLVRGSAEPGARHPARFALAFPV
jgi:hypothetical protein